MSFHLPRSLELPRKAFLIGLGVALAIRVSFIAANYLGVTEIEVVDSKRYFDEGARFLQGEEQVFAFRTPGYPLFVAYAGGLKPNLVALLQALLGLLTCGLVYWGALRLFGRPVARWATLFLALDMTTIILVTVSS